MALFQCRVVSAVDGKPIAGARAVFDAAGLGAGSRNAVRASGWLLPRSSHQRVRSAEADHVGDVSLTVFARPGRDVVRVEAPGFCSVEIPVSDAMPAHLALPAADVFPAHWADESASAESELRFAFEAKGRLVRLRTGTANRPRWHEVVDVEGFVWPFVGPRLVDVSVELLADEGSPPVERVFSSFAVVGESTVELR